MTIAWANIYIITLKIGQIIELAVNKNGRREWYFTLRKEGDNAIVENAWHYSNASNRAYRRGTSNPSAPLSQDDRGHQARRKITEHHLREIIKESIKKVLNII